LEENLPLTYSVLYRIPFETYKYFDTPEIMFPYIVSEYYDYDYLDERGLPCGYSLDL
jgi:hypothetical protein